MMRSTALRSIATKLAGLLVVLAASSCDQRRPITPTAPTAPAIPTAPAVPTVTLSGTVTERFSGQPIEGVQVFAWPYTYPTNRNWGWPPAGTGYRRTPSDSSGRYEIMGIPADFGSFWVFASGPGSARGQYRQQCATTVTLDSDAIQNVTLTARENIAMGNSRMPPRALVTRTVSGVVFEVTETGRQPIEGAWVGWEATLDGVAAETWSDATGRYLLCGLPETRLPSLFAVKTGYTGGLYVTAEAGSDAVLDIELKR